MWTCLQAAQAPSGSFKCLEVLAEGWGRSWRLLKLFPPGAQELIPEAFRLIPEAFSGFLAPGKALSHRGTHEMSLRLGFRELNDSELLSLRKGPRTQFTGGQTLSPAPTQASLC